ncbi:MAG: hypothetical protein O3A97_03860 [Proteobacteria bacterium]|nr:hypothetical protein [Pseudomonadota bacterium]
MAYDITIAGPETRALFYLYAPVQGPGLPPAPTRPCTRSIKGSRSLMWLGQARWLLMAPLAEEAELAASLPDTGGTLWSDALAFFTLSGADAGVAMAIACPLDLHALAFPEDGAAWSDAFGTKALLLREGACWVLGVEPSYADYVATHLAALI